MVYFRRQGVFCPTLHPERIQDSNYSPPRIGRAEPILNDFYSSLSNSHLTLGKKSEINPEVNLKELVRGLLDISLLRGRDSMLKSEVGGRCRSEFNKLECCILAQSTHDTLL